MILTGFFLRYNNTMKRLITITCTILLLCAVISCVSTNDDGNNEFLLKETQSNGKYQYTVSKTPAGYSNLKKASVFYQYETHIGNIWKKSVFYELQDLLNTGNFSVRQFYGNDCIFINGELLNTVLCSDFETEKQFIYTNIVNNYVGYPDMQAKGFSKEKFDEVTSYDELSLLFDETLQDTHFMITNNNGFTYRQEQRFDEDSIGSTDPYGTYFVTETSNVLYVRNNFCGQDNTAYQEHFADLAEPGSKKDFIVLDFRSNRGGSNSPQFRLVENLIARNYKGTVIVLQDNWSYSAGEVWVVTGYKDYDEKLNFKLVGTHSGGMQKYGNCVSYLDQNMFVYLPSSNFCSYVPSNYLGEGLGYEPDVWANVLTMKTTLESMGLDLTGVEFK